MEWVNTDINPNTILAVIGEYGDGVHIAGLRDLQNVRRFIFIEPGEFETENRSNIVQNRNAQWVTGKPRDLEHELRPIAVDLIECHLRIVFYDPCNKIKQKVRNAWVKTLESSIGRLTAGYLGLLCRGDESQANVINNIPAILDSYTIDSIEGLANGRPAFVIGGGPSLKKNVHLLRDAALLGPIVAVDTVYDLLIENGIMPDMIVTRDPTPEATKKFKNKVDDKTILVFHPESHPDCANVGNTRMWVRDRGIDLIEKIAPDLKANIYLTRTTNVGHMALCVAKQLKPSAIVLLGMDLALDPENGQTHTDGAIYSSESEFVDNGEFIEINGPQGIEKVKLHTVEDYNGKQIPTLAQFKRYVHHIENEIKNTDVPIYDITDFGAKKKGAINTTLRDFIYTVVLNTNIESVWHNIPLWQLLSTQLPPKQNTKQARKTLRKVLKDSKNVYNVGCNTLYWLQRDCIQNINRANIDNYQDVQNKIINKWLYVYHSTILRLIAGSALARLAHRVQMVDPVQFSCIQEGLNWLRLTNASFLEEALDLINEFGFKLESALNESMA